MISSIFILNGNFYKILFESDTHVYVQDSFGNKKRFYLAYFKTHANKVENISPKINEPPSVDWTEAFEPEIIHLIDSQ